MKKTQPTATPMSKKRLRTSQKAADLVTKIVGSWGFIITLFIIMGFWMSLNIYEFIARPWDPYPFILLNFVLSCLAAIQAPIILMSQNRTTERDRIRQQYDYLIDRKAEREIQDIQKDIKSVKNYLAKLNKKI